LKFPENNPSKALDEMVLAIYEIARDSDGNYRPEDLISAAAAFTGESAMRQAHDFDFDRHTFTPGRPVFSQKINEILSGDRTNWEEMPDGCVFGALYGILINHPNRPWPREDFPDVGGIYSRFAAARKHGASQAEWGKAPLSVPPSHYPSERLPPLRVAFDMRTFVYKSWAKEKLSADAVLTMAQLNLIMIMTQMQPQVDPAIGLLLAFETINAMAKTAPVLPKHMQEFWRKRGISVPKTAP
jgi:hypothetical protein